MRNRKESAAVSRGMAAVVIILIVIAVAAAFYFGLRAYTRRQISQGSRSPDVD